MERLKIGLLIFTLFACCPLLMAGEYPVSSIPKALLLNANAVIRKQEQVVEIHSLNKVTIKDHYVVTILNEAGDDHASWSEAYSKLNSISEVDGTLFDAFGNKIRSLKKSEIRDEKMYSQVNMVDEYRYKYHNFFYKNYPYTVEYESEVTQYETMFLPNWAPVPSRNIAVEQSSFSLITEGDYVVRFKKYNLDKAPVTTNNGKSVTMTWSVNQHPAIVREYAAPPLHELAPYISFGPSDFRLDDYTGSMRTWEEYGKFIISMNAGLSELPPAVVEKVNQLIAGAKTDEEKVTRIYEFMQHNTHYISIQLGVGGWKPFPANYVASKGYGDCKALSNYMVSLLKVAGIKANYVLIRAGDDERDISVDFPTSQFNHAICAVPLKNDTLWLECTSQTVPAGYMGGFTGNRHALMITENGGKMVSTPYYNKQHNIVSGAITGLVDAQGKLAFEARVKYKAVCSDDVHSRIHRMSREEQLKYLKDNLELPNYDISDFSYHEEKGRFPVITENLKIEAPNYAQVSGKRLFIVPNVLDKSNAKLMTDTARKYPVELMTERLELDTVTISLPAGYKPESLPKPMDISTPFGQYHSLTEVKGDQLVYYRSFAVNKGRFPAVEFNNLVKFYDQVYKADRTKVVLVKAE